MLILILIIASYSLSVWRIRYLRGLVRPSRRTKGGFIYAFTDWGQLLPVVKIGRATDPKQRLAAHKTAAPFGLFVFWVISTSNDKRAESVLHHEYKSYRVRSSGEWFWVTPWILWDMILLWAIARRRRS
jgi:hypothetical protein